MLACSITIANGRGSKNQIGLKSALEMEGLAYSGTQHRAIEDARNMARLFQVIAQPMALVKASTVSKK